MAQGLDAFAAHLKRSTDVMGEFRSEPFYQTETDTLIFYFRDTPSYEKRITKYLTIFLAVEDDSLVGIEIKGIKVIMMAIQNLGDVPISEPIEVKDEDGELIHMSFVMHFALGFEQLEAISGTQYEQLRDQVKEFRVRRSDVCPA